MLTGVASPIADRTGGVMSQLSKVTVQPNNSLLSAYIQQLHSRENTIAAGKTLMLLFPKIHFTVDSIITVETACNHSEGQQRGREK